MLVLSRKTGEMIQIGPQVTLTILRASRNHVRVGIEAPPAVSILRPDAKNKRRRAPQPSPGDLPRILLVDDSPEDRDAYRRLLTIEGESYVFQESDSGEEGLERCRKETPDCVLLDYLLPDLSGLEFLGELSGADGRPSVPVVMLTGHGDESLAVQAMKRGARDYLPKRDITGERLRRVVHDALAATWPEGRAWAQALHCHTN